MQSLCYRRDSESVYHKMLDNAPLLQTLIHKSDPQSELAWHRCHLFTTRLKLIMRHCCNLFITEGTLWVSVSQNVRQWVLGTISLSQKRLSITNNLTMLPTLFHKVKIMRHCCDLFTEGAHWPICNLSVTLKMLNKFPLVTSSLSQKRLSVTNDVTLLSSLYREVKIMRHCCNLFATEDIAAVSLSHWKC